MNINLNYEKSKISWKNTRIHIKLSVLYAIKRLLQII